MGFENRDYYRDSSYSRSFSSFSAEFPPVVKWLLIVNAVVFLLQIFITRPVPVDLSEFNEDERREIEKAMKRHPGLRQSVVQEWLELKPSKTVFEGQIWRLITNAFCHDRVSIWHLVINMLLLYLFGRKVENRLGSKEFLLFYLAGAVCSSLAYLALDFYLGQDIPAIGASGAVMAVLMLYTIENPFETVLFCFIIPMPLWLLLGLYVLFDLHPVLRMLAGDEVNTGVAHASHLGGLLFGFLYWKTGMKLSTLKLPRRQRAPKIRIYTPPPEPEPDDFTGRVDEILKKISDHGKESLTGEERAILEQASRRYRGRQ